MINRESINTLPFMEYLIDILIKRHQKITITSTNFLKKYRDLLIQEYANVLDYLQSNIANGNIIDLEQYIKNRINGNITSILDDFVKNYEENKKIN